MSQSHETNLLTFDKNFQILIKFLYDALLCVYLYQYDEYFIHVP